MKMNYNLLTNKKLVAVLLRSSDFGLPAYS